MTAATIPVERYGRGKRCEACDCQWLLHLFDTNPVADECAKDGCLCHDLSFCAAFEAERDRLGVVL